MVLLLKRKRLEAWKKNFKQKIGRDHLSSINNYIVAGSILDVLDHLLSQMAEKRKPMKDQKNKIKNDVVFYQMIRYPPMSPTKKNLLYNV